MTTENGLKRTGTQPACVAGDGHLRPELSRELPPGLSFVSGLNVIAHATKGFYARDGNPIMSLMVKDGIHALATRLRGIRNEPPSLEARSGCLYGA